MHAFLKVLNREVDVLLHRKDILIIMFGMPIVVCFFLWQMFICNTPQNLPIAVLNEDNSSISRELVRMLDATPTCNVQYQVLSLKEGKDLIVGGKAYALVVIPKNFKRDLFRTTPPQIIYYFNNQAILMGGIISKDVDAAVLTFSSMLNANILMQKGLPQYAAIANVNPVGIDEHMKSNPYLNYCYILSLAGFIHTFQILIAAISCWAIGRELKNGTAKEWLESADDSIIIAVLGKLLPYNLCFLFIIAVVYLLYFGVYGAPLTGNILLICFSTVLYVIAYQITPVMFVAVFSNLRLALSSTAFYTALGFTFEGMTFPRMAMPAFGQFYSALLPLSHYLAIMVDQTYRNFPVKCDFQYIYYLLILICLPLLFLLRLKHLAKDERAWYQI